MKYIICKANKAADIGIKPLGHRLRQDRILLNEKELTTSPALTGSLEERAAALGGEVYTYKSVTQIINKEGGWL